MREQFIHVGDGMATSANEERAHLDLTVTDSVSLCIKSFQTCLNKAALVHYRELSLVEDQLAKFCVWAANIHVFGAARSSLDHRLRKAPDVRNTVIALVQALDGKVQLCSSVLHSTSSSSIDDGSESISKELDEALGGLANNISLLHKLSNTIRRASKNDQNINATRNFTIRDDEGNDAEPFLQGLLANHIRDKFPGISDNIQQRLANTMVLRRKRLLYRKERYGKTPIQLRQIPKQPEIFLPKPKPRIDLSQETIKDEPITNAPQRSTQSVAHTATTLNPESVHKALNPSVISVSKTIALTSHNELRFPPPPCGVLFRKHNRLKKEKEQQHREFLAKIPGYKQHGELSPHHLDAIATNRLNNKISLEKEWNKSLQAIGEVTCPFCFYTLPIHDAVDEKKWKLHVKNDLDPYVCLFEECGSPGQLFSHSGVWLKHMQGHAMRWRCTSKSHNEFVGATREDYINHMKVSHPGKFNDVQLAVLANRNARLTGPLFKSCPLCGVEEVEGSIEQHVVGHMLFLALKSLPSYQEDIPGLYDESNGEMNSVTTSKPHSRSTVKNNSDGNEPMTFDDSSNSTSKPAPGAPLLSDEDDKLPTSFFEDITAHKSNTPSFGEGLRFADGWLDLPPHFMSSTTSFGQQPGLSIAPLPVYGFYNGLGGHYGIMPMGTNMMPPPPPPPVGHLRHQRLEEFQEDSRRISSGEVENTFTEWVFGSHEKQQVQPPTSSEYQWGSDSSFNNIQGYSINSEKETTELTAKEQPKYSECFEPSQSAGNTQPGGPSPSSMVPLSHGQVTSVEAQQDTDAPPRKRQMSLTEEQEREDHIYDEQKRRALIKECFDDLCDLVPGLRGGGFSESTMLAMAAEWLEELLKGNALLAAQLATLEGR